ncbi:MAG TPA: NAD-dependent epimerase/dehydratase family protein [Polyangiaceae bacterium]|nr:NAD-dependent epimerase/dehydratase family protein [Polyangiaceae bacterium]
MSGLAELAPTRSWRCLVTGAAGFLGGAMVRRLRAEGCFVRATSRRPLPWAESEGLETVSCDLLSLDACRALLEGIDTVFHFAAPTSAVLSARDPDGDRRQHLEPLVNLARASRPSDSRVMLFAGTVTQAGLPQRLPLDEAHLDQPATFYDAHKLLAEYYVRLFATAGAWSGISLRLPTVYGPGASVAARDRGVVNAMIRRALRGQELPIYESGDWLRDFLFVDDAISAFIAAAHHAHARAGFEVFTIGAQSLALFRAFELVASSVAELTSVRSALRSVPLPEFANAVDTASYSVDSSRFTSQTGWQPRVEFSSGVRRTIEAFLSEVERPQSDYGRTPG